MKCLKARISKAWSSSNSPAHKLPRRGTTAPRIEKYANTASKARYTAPSSLTASDWRFLHGLSGVYHYEPPSHRRQHHRRPVRQINPNALLPLVHRHLFLVMDHLRIQSPEALELLRVRVQNHLVIFRVRHRNAQT